MVTREAATRKKSPHVSVVDDNGNKNALFWAGRIPPTTVVVSEGATTTKGDRREPTFVRPSRIEQGRLEQRDSRISRHDVLESFREETRSQRGRSTSRSTRHQQRSQSTDLSGMHLMERNSHQRPKELQGILIATQGREDSDALFPDPRAKLKPAPYHAAHAKIRRIQGPNRRMRLETRHTPKESVTLEDKSVLGCSRRIHEKSHRAPDLATRDSESGFEGATESSNFWSRLRCKSHAHEETSPNLTVTSYEDGLEAADAFLRPPDLSQGGLRSIFAQPSTRKHPTVRGMYPNAANTCDSSKLIEMLERKLRDLKDSSNPDMTAPEVGYLVAALSRLRDDALHLQGAPNSSRSTR